MYFFLMKSQNLMQKFINNRLFWAISLLQGGRNSLMEIFHLTVQKCKISKGKGEKSYTCWIKMPNLEMPWKKER